MTPTALAVRPASFTAAAEDFEKIHDDIRTTLDRLVLGLGGAGAMAGSDSTGRRFAQSYDSAVNGNGSLLAGVALLGNACGKMAELLDASAVNHHNANTGFAVCTPTNPSGSPKNVETIPVVSLGSSYGGPGEPSNWEKLQAYIRGQVFPDGNPVKLSAAGDAWTTAATELRTHQAAIDQAIGHIAGERSVEVGPAQDQAGMIKSHLGGGWRTPVMPRPNSAIRTAHM